MGLNATFLARIRGVLAEPGARTDEQLLDVVLRLAAMWRSRILANTVIQKYGPRVLAGPFAGMEYLPEAAEGALLPRLTGAYECELHSHLLALAGEGLTTVVDVGCAEGYYAVGLARLMPGAAVHAYDIDPRARAACARLAGLNGVADRIRIGETFTGDDYARFEPGCTLIFMDVEGAEVELLDPVRWPALAGLKIVVETHGGPTFAVADELTRRFASTHEVIRVDHGPKTTPLPPWIATLGHLDQLLAGWEFRLWPTPWLVMRPNCAG